MLVFQKLNLCIKERCIKTEYSVVFLEFEKTFFLNHNFQSSPTILRGEHACPWCIGTGVGLKPAAMKLPE